MISNGEVDAAAVAAVISVVTAFIAAVGAARAAFTARLASKVGRALAQELGEEVARNLLLELTPEAATALKNKLGADMLKRIGRRFGVQPSTSWQVNLPKPRSRRCSNECPRTCWVGWSSKRVVPNC